MHWVDLVDHLLTSPERGMETAELTAELADTFDTNASWNWADADGGFGFEMLDQPAGWPTEAETDFWAREAMPLHPLIVWFAVTGDSTAMTIGRVPSAVGTRRGRELVVECLARVGLDEQLSIPYQLSPRGYRAFVLATTGTDYCDEQLTLAVLALLAEGLTAEAIGRRLGVSRHTVRKHLEHLYRKLGVGDRLVAVREARARGILPEYDAVHAPL